MIEREDWGARPRSGASRFRNTRRKLVGHHTAGDLTTSIEESMAMMRSTQSFHQTGKGWTDIAYNLAVDSLGNLLEGRGFSFQNGANAPENATSYSVVYLGNTEVHPFTTAAAQTVFKLKEYLDAPVEACPGGCGLYGHRDINPTLCPGEKFYAWILGGSQEPVC